MTKRFFLLPIVPLFLIGFASAQEATPNTQEAAPAALSGREHRLVVTTNPDTYLTTAYVDGIIRQMNVLIANADPSCSDTHFVRSGQIIYDT